MSNMGGPGRFKALVGGGMDVTKAAALTGLLEAEG